MAKKKYKILSLFSGCGGLDLGFSGGFNFLGKDYKQLNTEIIFANDFDPDACKCYNANALLVKNGVECLLEDIRNVDAKQIPDFDILLAGFPCQPFSNAGNRKGVHDANGRGTLFEECVRIIKSKINVDKRPKAFLFENVRGILSSKMPDGETSVPQEIQNRMETLGYNVSIKLVCSSDYGVPQRRYRVLIVGVDKQLNRDPFNFDLLLDVVNKHQIPSTHTGNDEKLLLGYILRGVHEQEDDVVWDYSITTQNTVKLIGGCKHGPQALDLFVDGFSKNELPSIVYEGRSWKDIPYDKLSPRFKKIADDPKRYHAPKFFRRFAYGEINGTITASAQPENCGITHPVENRRYSVRECARIQSFPDDFRFNAIPIQSQYKVIGNAVPPVMAWVVANALLDYIK
ncbi:MAG: DNA cytosine methyltransferase [Paludibacteraceae bacterium]|nr:DNA cytosine methyltransferase [Paludibacteraceae bacterium]